MTKVIAINEASKEAIERQDSEVMKEEFKNFIQTDPEVRAMMLERARQVISKMSEFDFCYHGGFKEVALDIMKSESMRPLMEEVFKSKILSDDSKSIEWRVHEAVGQALAERLEVKLTK